MQDSVFLDNRTFQRVWQRVAGSMDAPVTTPPEADTLTDLLAECIRAKAAGAAFYTALAQRIRTANVAAQQKPARIRIELTGMTRYNGTFTASDAQTLAVRLLDGVCDALAD